MTIGDKHMEYKKYKDQRALCLDWETSGSEWGADSSVEHQGVSFGAVIFDTATLLPVKTLYREIQFDPNLGLAWQGKQYKWSEEAQAIHGLSRERLATSGVTQADAAIDLAELILEYFDPQRPILFMGHNVDYDIRFTEQLMQPYEIMFKVAHTKLDTSGAAWINFGIHKSNDMFDFLGLQEREEHNALEDALMTLEAARRMRMLAQSALNA